MPKRKSAPAPTTGAEPPQPAVGDLVWVLGLGGEAHEHLTRRAGRTELTQDVGGGLELDRGWAVVLLQLLIGLDGGPEVGGRPRGARALEEGVHRQGADRLRARALRPGEPQVLQGLLRLGDEHREPALLARGGGLQGHQGGGDQHAAVHGAEDRAEVHRRERDAAARHRGPVQDGDHGGAQAAGAPAAPLHRGAAADLRLDGPTRSRASSSRRCTRS